MTSYNVRDLKFDNRSIHFNLKANNTSRFIHWKGPERKQIAEIHLSLRVG